MNSGGIVLQENDWRIVRFWASYCMYHNCNSKGSDWNLIGVYNYRCFGCNTKAPEHLIGMKTLIKWSLNDEEN